MQAHEERPLPFLGTNVDFDLMGWTERLDGAPFRRTGLPGGPQIDGRRWMRKRDSPTSRSHYKRNIQAFMFSAPSDLWVS